MTVCLWKLTSGHRPTSILVRKFIAKKTKKKLPKRLLQAVELNVYLHSIKARIRLPDLFYLPSYYLVYCMGCTTHMHEVILRHDDIEIETQTRDVSYWRSSLPCASSHRKTTSIVSGVL